MTEAQFRQELKRGLAGVYFIWGAEEYLKRFYIGRAKKLTLGDDEEAAQWNYYEISASQGDARLADLEEAVYSVPLMGDKTFIKYFAPPTDMKKTEEERLRDLCEALDSDRSVMFIVADADGFDPGRPEKNKPSAAYKFYSGFCKTVDIGEQTPSELKKWISRRLAADSVAIDATAAELLLERCSHDMFILSGELDKLSAYALSANLQTVDSEAVMYVTSPYREEDGFALANALLDGDRRRALKVLQYSKQQREEPVRVMAQIVRSFCDMLAVAALVEEGADAAAVASKMKMHSYRASLYVCAVRDKGVRRIAAALERCREADIQLKTTRLDYIALERFICTIPAKSRKQDTNQTWNAKK